MEQKFREWLLKRGNSGAAGSYPKAIHNISAHYSKEIGVETDIYKITDQLRISEIAHDYSQSGKFSKFGYEQHSRFRAAIARYSEFFVQHEEQPLDEDSNEESTTVGTPATPSNSFAYERDLQTALCAQISELFQDYRIFGDSSIGIEYLIGGKKIDVLLESKDGAELIAVELKSGVADFKVFGQISMYMGLLMAQFPEKKISGVIIASAIDSSLRHACHTSDRVTLKVYRMSIELDDA